MSKNVAFVWLLVTVFTQVVLIGITHRVQEGQVARVAVLVAQVAVLVDQAGQVVVGMAE